LEGRRLIFAQQLMDSGGKARSVFHWMIAWTVGMVFWLLLTGTFDPFELAAGVLASALAATAAALVRMQHIILLSPRPVWFLRVPRLIPRLLRDSWAVLFALIRQLLNRQEMRVPSPKSEARKDILGWL
jgi:multisubunit Na+/H+ antiporter MnhE subunit